MTVSSSMTWKCDTPFCGEYVTFNGSASYEQIREHLADWTLDNGGRDTCAKCNLGRCPGLTGGVDHFGDRCPCVHPNGHDGACQCKHQMVGAVR